MNADALQLLKDSQLRKTNARIQVLEIFMNADRALSHQNLESKLQEVDRVTLYRTLKTFEQKGLIHKAFDGSEALKYALCSHHACDEHHHNDNHIHFNCEVCEKTICLEQVKKPELNLPEGYQVAEQHVLVKGICPDCANL